MEHFPALPVGGIGNGYDQKLAFLISLGLLGGIFDLWPYLPVVIGDLEPPGKKLPKNDATVKFNVNLLLFYYKNEKTI